MIYVIAGFALWWLAPAWLLAVFVVLLFMAGASRKPTPRRRRR